MRLALLFVAVQVLYTRVAAQVSEVDDDAQVAPASIGSDVALTYFGPPPSAVDKRLVGPVQLLKSGEIDFEAGTITLPLYQGEYSDGSTHWYILTDTTDPVSGLPFVQSFSLDFSSLYVI